MRYIDLFAGLGGFHIALGKLGHQCVFASEIKENLIQLYESNFSIKPAGDIRAIKSKDIPAHDVLCAGFPCQPFSKAGLQKGLDDESNGDLFMQIVRILKYHKPSYFIL
jgi:DNA (cytosine-5)-methyltransferase 1